MKILALIMMFSLPAMAIEKVANHCRYHIEVIQFDGYTVEAPKGICEVVSLDVLTGKECKDFVKEKTGACYQVGKIYENSDLTQEIYSPCFACQR